MDSELLLKFIGCFPDYLLPLSCTLFFDNLCQNSCIIIQACHNNVNTIDYSVKRDIYELAACYLVST